MHNIPSEPELIHSPGMEVFNEYIGILNQFRKDILTIRSSGIKGQRFFVAVKLKEIITRIFRVELKFTSCGITRTWTFYFNHFGAKPG